jgi:predicted RNA polymerase sigma factor
MLQTVLGLDAARIGAAFLVPAGTMGQRLVRAKTKIRDAGIAFELPEKAELASRVEAVLEAIYACYGVGWDTPTGGDAAGRDLVDEAMWLARLVVELLPAQPEAKGLLALMLHCEARRGARRDGNGRYVPLSQQDTHLWSRPMMVEAERWLAEAAEVRRLGRFQLEAAIQSAHAQRAFTGRTDWEAIALLYEGLVRLSPSLGALVGRAAALANARDPASGLAALDAIDVRSVLSYQPYWAVRAHLLGGLGQIEAARESYSQAIGLCEDRPVRDFLIRSRDRLAAGQHRCPDRAE